MICAQGQDHDALKRDAARWAQLPLVGMMVFRDRAVELRNCACESTLAIRVAEPVRRPS